MTNLDFMVSIPLLRGAGVCFGCAIPDTPPAPLKRGIYKIQRGHVLAAIPVSAVDRIIQPAASIPVSAVDGIIQPSVAGLPLPVEVLTRAAMGMLLSEIIQPYLAVIEILRVIPR